MRLAPPRLGTLAHRLYSFYFIYFPTCGFVWKYGTHRYPSVSSNSPLHEHQIAIFWEHPIFSGRKSQFVQTAWHCGCLVSSDGFNIFQICVMSRKFQHNMLIMLLVDSFYMFLLFMLRVCFKSILLQHKWNDDIIDIMISQSRLSCLLDELAPPTTRRVKFSTLGHPTLTISHESI